MAEKSTQYTVLARRFRPQSFGEVIGQQPVARALQNALRDGRVAHAYLFTGARGVGKTSMARILAKALNCPNATDHQPCNGCEICQGIAAGHDVDVLEIDGASNRGIDDIRSLRANVNVKSMRSPYKVYIIDEVHMLTREAFNALLKTLEEPPPNVKFVFCTTEPNKVPDTILSRCQRFDFASIETQNIMTRLAEIAEAEGFRVEPSALELVARRASGSMRDSQSLFDQLLAFGEDPITADDVHRLLGTASDDRLMEIIGSLVARRRDAALELFDKALAGGVQLGELVDQLIVYVRDLMVLAAGAEAVSLMSVSQEARPRLAEQARQWGLPTIVAAMQVLAETKSRMFRASSARALAELALIRVSLLDDLQPLDQLLQELRNGSAPSGRPASPRPAAGSPPQNGPTQTPPPTNIAARTEPSAEKKNAAEAPAERTVQPVPAVNFLEFAEGREQELWSQMTAHIQDMLSDHVRVVSGVAISGPNHLDLTFPKSYHFSKQYCERPEMLSRLEKLAEQVTGRPIRISMRLAEEPAPEQPARQPEAAQPAARTTNQGAYAPRSPDEPITDPFVQHALSIFGAAVAKVEARKS